MMYATLEMNLIWATIDDEFCGENGRQRYISCWMAESRFLYENFQIKLIARTQAIGLESEFQNAADTFLFAPNTHLKPPDLVHIMNQNFGIVVCQNIIDRKLIQYACSPLLINVFFFFFS